MADEVFLFIDFDDTLSSSHDLNTQYARELSLLLSQDLGNEPGIWEPLIQAELEQSLALYSQKFKNSPLAGYTNWIEEERGRFLLEIARQAQVKLPSNESSAAYAARLQFDALTMCNASFPAAEETLRTLFDDNVRVQLASSQESQYLLAALIGAGIESYTESKFGPDLLDCAKEGPEFYKRIFESCRIDPQMAIVIDDQPTCLQWAKEAGARVIQACMLPNAAAAAEPITITQLRDIPAILAKMV